MIALVSGVVISISGRKFNKTITPAQSRGAVEYHLGYVHMPKLGEVLHQLSVADGPGDIANKQLVYNSASLTCHSFQ